MLALLPAYMRRRNGSELVVFCGFHCSIMALTGGIHECSCAMGWIMWYDLYDGMVAGHAS